jgi:3',5'-cyclic-nucleotide phosphodiesterase
MKVRYTKNALRPALTVTVHVCQSGTACVAKLAELADASAENLIPTLVLVNIPHDDHLDESKPARTPSPLTRSLTDLGPDEVDGAFYGLDLLRWIVLDIQQRNLSKLVVPVAVAAASMDQQTSTDSGCESATDETADCEGERRRTSDAAQILLEPRRTMKYIDLGAVDVLSSPIPEDRLPSLAIHAYRAHKESLKDRNAFLEVKRGRKRSWVGLDDEKPYAYLREAMVSGLMDGICRVGASDDAPVKQARLSIALQRRERIQDSIGTWYFSAHDFTDDELLHAAQLMLQHALEIPELSQWRISTGKSRLSSSLMEATMQLSAATC